MKGLKKYPGLLPTKKWLTLQEAAAYLDMSDRHFKTLHGLTVSIIGNKRYYRVAELEQLIEKNILITSN